MTPPRASTQRVARPRATPTLNEAVAHHLAGRLDAAERAYRQLLEKEPLNAPARNNLGSVLAARGEMGAAIACFATAAEADPQYGEAFRNFALALAQQGRDAEAIAPLTHAVTLEPTRAQWWYELGLSTHAAGDVAGALTALDRALALDDGRAAIHAARAVALYQLGRLDDAAASAEWAMHLDATLVDAWLVMGMLRRTRGELAEARAALERALALDPSHVMAGIEWVLVRVSEGAQDEALPRAQALAERCPENADAWSTLSVVHAERDDEDAAAIALDRAMALRPHDATLQWHRSVALLTAGHLREGFALFETRAATRFGGAMRRPFPWPTWDGRPLDGRTIYVSAEQGLGDFLHFVRYVPLLTGRGAGRIVLECPDALRSLIEPMRPADRLVGTGDVVEGVDVHVALMSLAHHFGTTIDSVPAAPSYMMAPARPATTAAVRALPGLRVGLAWTGSPKYLRDRQRSLPVSAVMPLLAVPGVSFVSLHAGPPADPLRAHPRVLTPDGDLAETAAAMAACDLVISVDTALAHLAGALGVPTWLALSHVADWRWMRERADTPWYPRTTLVRQRRAGDWTSVVQTLSAMLATRAAQVAASGSDTGE